MIDLSDYVGIPFQDDGDSRDGINCWNLYRLVLSEQCKVELPSYAEVYKDAKDSLGIRRGVNAAQASDSWLERPFTPEPYDLVLLRVCGFPWHVAVYAGDYKMLSARRGSNSCIERIDSLIWKNNILGFWFYVKN